MSAANVATDVTNRQRIPIARLLDSKKTQVGDFYAQPVETAADPDVDSPAFIGAWLASMAIHAEAIGKLGAAAIPIFAAAGVAARHRQDIELRVARRRLATKATRAYRMTGNRCQFQHAELRIVSDELFVAFDHRLEFDNVAPRLGRFLGGNVARWFAWVAIHQDAFAVFQIGSELLVQHNLLTVIRNGLQDGHMMFPLDHAALLHRA